MSREKQIEEIIDALKKCSCVYTDCEQECAQCSNEELYDDTLNHIARTLYEADYRKQEWISVEERLPETTCECLAVGKSGCIFLLCYSSRYMAFNATDGDGEDRWKVNDITHWMPLPEPPKGE